MLGIGENAVLTEAQLSQFCKDGFLQLPGLVAPAACAHLVERSLQRLPSHWERGRPDTWTGPVTDSCHTAELIFRRGHLKFQKGPLLTDEVAIAAFGARSPVAEIAGTLLGTAPKAKFRGLYMIVPFEGSGEVARYNVPHVEAHPVQIVATAYLEDVGPGAGGLLVWPGSHRELYPDFRSKLDFIAGENYKRIFRTYRRLEPLELPGKAGDVILIHHRLFHAPSLNASRRIRFALLCDYVSPHADELCAARPGEDPFEDFSGLSAAARRMTGAGHRYRSADPADLTGVAPMATHHTALNKRDASRLARALQDGDTWIQLSDNAALAGTNKIAPCGLDLAKAGVRVFADAAELSSFSLNDFIAKAPPGAPRRLRIIGADRPIWLRIIRVRLPIHMNALLVDRSYEAAGDIELSLESVLGPVS